MENKYKYIITSYQEEYNQEEKDEIKLFLDDLIVQDDYIEGQNLDLYVEVNYSVVFGEQEKDLGFTIIIFLKVISDSIEICEKYDKDDSDDNLDIITGHDAILTSTLINGDGMISHFVKNNDLRFIEGYQFKNGDFDDEYFKNKPFTKDEGVRTFFGKKGENLIWDVVVEKVKEIPTTNELYDYEKELKDQMAGDDDNIACLFNHKEHQIIFDYDERMLAKKELGD